MITWGIVLPRGKGTQVKMSAFNFLNHKCTFKYFEHYDFENFPQPWLDMQVSEKIQQIFLREIKL